MPLEPGPNRGGFVGGEVVADQMYVQRGRNGLVDGDSGWLRERDQVCRARVIIGSREVHCTPSTGPTGDPRRCGAGGDPLYGTKRVLLARKVLSIDSAERTQGLH